MALTGFFSPTPNRFPVTGWWHQPDFRRALIASQVLALWWWGVGIILRELGVFVWADQEIFFRPVVDNFFHPYNVAVVMPPWMVVFLAPFRFVPLLASTLLQTALFFAIFTAVIFKFGGRMGATLIVLTSYIAMDAIIQMNLEWVVLLGLLVPLRWSAPMLAIKPHIAFGYYFGFPWRRWVPVAVVGAAVFLISLVVWWLWPLDFVAMLQVWEDHVTRVYNAAPSGWMTPFVSVPIGIALAIWAYRRQDPLLGIMSGVFITPYIAFYSLVIPFAMLAIRLPKIALVISVMIWVIIGGYGAYLIILYQQVAGG